MTDIDKLEAGRELDALVAEGMGWEVCPCQHNGDLIRNGQVADHWNTNAPEFEYAVKLPSYSTSISAAWKVVEKFAKDNWDWSVSTDEVYFQFGDSQKPGYKCGISFFEGFALAPLAICRAALKAMKGE